MLWQMYFVATEPSSTFSSQKQVHSLSRQLSCPSSCKIL